MQAGAGELYARLLCEFEPAAALPFLQAHDAYQVEEVLPHTQRFGVEDAQVSIPSVSCWGLQASGVLLRVKKDGRGLRVIIYLDTEWRRALPHTQRFGVEDALAGIASFHPSVYRI